MLTDNTIKVMRHTDEGLVQTYEGRCHVEYVKAYEVKRYGEEHADTAAIYVPDINADICKGDYITYGGIDEPLVVTSVEANAYGSPSMRHLKVGAV